MYTHEMVPLVELIKSVAPESVLEIGVHYGSTARVILDNVDSIKSYIGIDLTDSSRLWDKQKGDMPTEPAKYVLKDSRFKLILRPFGSFDLTPADIGPVDVVFIDGDHSTGGVEHDTALALGIAQKLIIWHDYNEHVDVKPFLDSQSATLPIQHIAETWLAYHKI